jgi:hypothetical protein
VPALGRPGAASYVDVFSCKPFDPEPAATIAEQHFGGRSNLTVLHR